MKLIAVRVLRGPNVWRPGPLLEITLEAESAAALNWLGTLVELQSAAWKTIEFARLDPLPEPGQCRALVGYEDELLAQECVREAMLLHQSPADQRCDAMAAAIGRLREFAAKTCVSQSAWAIAKAAQGHGVPWQRIGGSELLLLGYGCKQRRVGHGETDHAGRLAHEIAANTELLSTVLHTIGVPEPKPADPVGGATAVPTPPPYHLLMVGQQLIAASQGDASSPADVTSQVPPQTVAQCATVLQALGLDVADVLVSDLSPWRETPSGGVIGVTPGLGDEPLFATPAALARFGEALIGHLYPAASTGRIPLVSVTGVNGKTTTTRLIAHLLKGLGLYVGMTCTDGVFVDGRCIDTDDCSGPKSARRVLRNPLVEAAVCEVARGGILREGLGFDACDVAVVTNIADGDHLGLSWVKTPADLARVKRVIVEAVSPGGWAVLKGDDPLVSAMAAHCPGRVAYFCCDAEHPVIVAHRAEGGRVLIERDGWIVLANGNEESVVIRSADIPLTRGGLLAFQLENVLAAVGAAAGLNVPLEIIRERLLTFDSDIATCPARFNVLNLKGATVILDYGHNPSAVAALVRSIERFPATRRHVVYSADGDRTDEQIRQQVIPLADAFDRVVLYEEVRRFRGRRPGELYNLLRQGLAGGRRVREIEQVDGELAAIDYALGSLQAGELMLIQVDAVSEDLAFVRDYIERSLNS